jgi:hypothetical protein
MKAACILGTIAGLLLPTLAMAQVSLRPCLEIEDQTKERLDCYDAQIKPAPKKTSGPAKTVNECRFIQEQDERLNCFNKFVTASAKKNTAPKKPKTPK